MRFAIRMATIPRMVPKGPERSSPKLIRIMTLATATTTSNSANRMTGRAASAICALTRRRRLSSSSRSTAVKGLSVRWYIASTIPRAARLVELPLPPRKSRARVGGAGALS
jgi:hypothetical protein